MKITQLAPGDFVREPGAYLMPSQVYLDDPCPDSSLTQSIAKLLIDQSARHAWANHPRLNPQFERNDDSKFDMGNVCHRLMLGRGKEFEVFDAADWNASGGGKGAKTELHMLRDKARADGKTPILVHQYHKAAEMCRVGQCYVDIAGFKNAFVEGTAELVLCWEEDGIWLRTMIDHVEDGLCAVNDFKSTLLSVARHNIGRLMAGAGWDVQAAMFERGLAALDPDNAGRREYRFFAQEAYEPYAMTVQVMPESALTIGRKKLHYAIDIWRECMTSGRWPGYEPAVVSEPLPGWAETQWLEREMVAVGSSPRPPVRVDSPLSVVDAG